jgi:hypothetical protein
MTAVVIYQQAESGQHSLLGNPITRIELLSPANKVGGSYYYAYLRRRREALIGGLPLVEIDYLHESRPPVFGLPAYPNDPRAYPYHVIISDPRLPPTVKAVRAYGFGVDAPIPAVNIPLAGNEVAALALHEVYHFTFKAGRWGDQVDYALEPERLHTYSPADQQRIRDRMAALQATSIPTEG